MKFIRTHSNSLWVKVIMGIMAISFAAWGLGSEMFNTTPTNKTWLIKIKDREYNMNDLQTVLRSLRNTQNPLQPQLPEAELQQRAIDELIDNGLLEQEAKRLGIAISDDMVRHEIVGMAAFKDENGQFSREKFDIILKENGLNEIVLIDKIRQHMSHDQLLRIFQINQGTIAPQQKDILIQAIYAPREVRIVELNSKDLPAPSVPDSKALETFLKANQEQFMKPESRNVSYVQITREILKKTNPDIEVSDKEIAAEYEKRSGIWSEPETRDIRQIILQNQQDAISAYGQLVAGTDFAKVAKKNKSTHQYTEFLQNVTPSSLGQDIGSVLFALPEGKFSAPIKTPLGWHIFKIEKIYPSHTKTIDSAKDQLKNDIKLNKEYSLLNDLVHKIDTELKASSLEEIAKNYNLELKTANTSTNDRFDDKKSDVARKVARSDKKSDGFNQDPIEYNSSFLTAAFTTELNQNSIPTPIYHNKNKNDHDDSYVILRVNSIKSEELPEFSTIKDQVAIEWTKQYQKERLKSLASTVKEMLSVTLDNQKKTEDLDNDKKQNDKIETNIRNITSNTAADIKTAATNSIALKELATSVINKSKTITINRATPPPQNIPLPLVEELFNINNGQATKIYNNKTHDSYEIGRVEQVKYFNKQELAEQKIRFGSSTYQIYQNLLIEEYLSYLRTQYNPQINMQLLQQNN